MAGLHSVIRVLCVTTTVLLGMCLGHAKVVPSADDYHRPSTDKGAEMEQQLQLLSKQVRALFERRQEDMDSLERNIRKNLFKCPDLDNLKLEIQSLRMEVLELKAAAAAAGEIQRNTNDNKQSMRLSTGNQKNDHLTIKWLSNAVNEVRTELSEIQNAINSTIILQNHEQLDTDLLLLKSDAASVNEELQISQRKSATFEADMVFFREDLETVKIHCRDTAVSLANVKNELSSMQLEWRQNWASVHQNAATKSLVDSDRKAADIFHYPRHQRWLKKQLRTVDKAVKSLQQDSAAIKSNLSAAMEKIDRLEQSNNNMQQQTNLEERISDNEIEKFGRSSDVNPRRRWSYDGMAAVVARRERGSVWKKLELHTLAISNLTKQMTNFDKLHMSMLELLENVEEVESKVDRNIPELQKEISKVELDTSDAISQISILREDQSNVRQSMKAIGVSVSNLQDRCELKQEVAIRRLDETVDKLIKSTSLQAVKLQDHILKSESLPSDANQTKSTIHLVQELKLFEKEYKGIVNKLPHDCSAVDGPNGIYLLSPGDLGEPIVAYCEHGWTTIQRRIDGSVDFNRNWNEYANGFGSPSAEHWLGNRNIHYLTAGRDDCVQLQIHMRDIYGKYWQASYDHFHVSDYGMGFKLSVANYSGNASDALAYQNEMEFSAIDNDRDISNTHCARNYEGGWWFSHCQHANLNGRYNLGLTWFDSLRNEWIAVAASEMRIRPRTMCRDGAKTTPTTQKTTPTITTTFATAADGH